MARVTSDRGVRRWSLGVGMALALAVTSVAPAFAQDAEVPSVPETAAGTTVALVSTQRAGDNGPVDDMVRALEQGATDFGVVTTFIEATDPSTYEQTLRNLAQTGTQIIITTFPGMQQPLASIAPEFPEVRFVHIFADPDETPVDNLRRVAYVIHPGFYLGGILAASLAQARGETKIGYIGGVALPSLAANYHAYVAGAQSVDPEVQVQGAWADSFEDAAKGLEIASAMYADGVQVIQTDSAATSNGVLDAAIAADALMIKDSDPSQISLAPDRIPAVSFLAFGESLYQELTAALQEEWQGGAVQSGLAEGITGLATSEEFAAATDDAAVAEAYGAALALIDEAKAQILSGELEVPFNTDPTF
ncbi:BMP family ABC transporter substrate-binding protein [soil metagenome]